MKIGIDIRSLMEEKYSGVQEYVLNLLNSLFLIDKNNEYVLFYNSYKDVSKRMPRFNQENVNIINSNIPNKVFNWLMQKTLKYPKIDKKINVDIYFMPNIGPIALSNKVKKIITIHDLSFEHYKKYFSLKRQMWHKFVNVQNILNSFSSIIAVSEHTKQDIIDLFKINKNKIKVVYPGLNKEYFNISLKNKDILRVKEKYSLPSDFILSLSTIEPRKNIESLILAFNDLLNNTSKNIFLVIAGGKGWKYKNIFKVFKNIKHKKRIKFIGYVDKKDKIALYRMAKIFVFPSFYEGFGFPPLEAMACGTPVITSNVSSLPEVISNAGLMVDPFNYKDISLAMKSILDDNDLSNILTQEGKKRIDFFVWNKTAQKYLEIFNSI